MSEIEFRPWPKTPRVGNVRVAITEKMDGTNACVIVDDGQVVGAQSRNRLIKPGDDNMGFAFWVWENAADLANLGDGYHYGEWVGPGIQKNKHNLDQKTFFLFDTGRWSNERPACCEVVDLLYFGVWHPNVAEEWMVFLKDRADRMEYTPEGIVLYFPHTGERQKCTFEHSQGKWRTAP